MYKVYIKENYLFIEDSATPDINKMNARKNVYIERDGTIFNFYREARDFLIITLQFSDIVNELGDPYTDIDEFIVFVVKKTGSDLNFSHGGADVSVQDQNTPVIVAYMSEIDIENTVAIQTVIDDITVTLTDATGFLTGQYFSLFNVTANRFFLANILGVAGNVISLDTPLDFAYPVGSFATGGNNNMAVDGSVTPVVFGLRNTDAQIGTVFDITRIILKSLTDSNVDLSKFGDIDGGLTKGIIMRKVDGTTRNIFNAKSNGELKNLMFDFDILDAQNINQGQDGFVGRLTFAGQSKLGVTIRLALGEDLNLIIQDDLSSLQSFRIIVEGHEVE